MATVYGVVDRISGNPNFKNDCQAIYDLLSTAEGMKACRRMLRILGLEVNSGRDLADQLVRSEEHMGFSKYALLAGDRILPDEEFLSLIADKRAIIDAAATSWHGVNTHRLQWWLVNEAYLKHEITLTTLPGALYTAIGNCRITGTGGKYLWDDLFDQGDEVKVATKTGDKAKSFGSPEYFCGTWLLGKSSNPRGKTDEARDQYQRLSKAFKELEEDNRAGMMLPKGADKSVITVV